MAIGVILYNTKWLNCNVSFFAKLCFPLRPLLFEKNYRKGRRVYAKFRKDVMHVEEN